MSTDDIATGVQTSTKAVTSLPRIWEIDFLRGLCIILMVIYHAAYDMMYFYSLPLPCEHWVVLCLAKFFAGLFILISGASCTLSHSNLKRGIKLLVIAIGIYFTLSFIYPDANIVFGILHLLSLSILLYPLTSCLPAKTLIVIGLFIMGSTFFTNNFFLSRDYLSPLGLHSPSFSSFDYFPLIPWYGVFLLGEALGLRCYRELKSPINVPFSENIITRAGRHTLTIYLLHQPVILMLLYLILGPPSIR